jgi:hypothetical protein
MKIEEARVTMKNSSAFQFANIFLTNPPLSIECQSIYFYLPPGLLCSQLFTCNAELGLPCFGRFDCLIDPSEQGKADTTMITVR